MSSPWAPTFEPLFVVGGAAAAWAYARAAKHDPPGRARIAAFTAGILLIVLALNSPLETIAVDYLLLFHLLQNVIISDWAPPLLILGLTPAMRSAIAGTWRPAVRVPDTARRSRSRSGSSAGTPSTSEASTTRRSATRSCSTASTSS